MGQKEKSSYISLLKQVKEGLEKGYSDSDKDMVSAVLKSITSDL